MNVVQKFVKKLTRCYDPASFIGLLFINADRSRSNSKHFESLPCFGKHFPSVLNKIHP